MSNPFFTPAEWEGMQKRLADPNYAPRIPDTRRPVYLFGGGGFYRAVKPFLDQVAGLKLRGVLDNDPAKHGEIIQGLRVYPPEEAAAHILREDALVVISMCVNTYIAEAENLCRRLNLPCTVWDDFSPPNHLSAASMLLAEHRQSIDFLPIWADDESRRVYRDIIRYRVTGAPEDRPRATLPQYFIKEIPPGMLRDFVDCGAFSGDTLLAFKAHCNGEFNAYYAFEPSADRLPALATAADGDPRIQIYPYAVSDFTGTCGWGNAGGSSALDSSKATQVEVRRLDDIIGEKRVTYIKMDVEGSELTALYGCEVILRRERPALAICVYHHPEDLWSIPRWIMSLNLGYQPLLRHHSPSILETVFYALPK